MRRSRPCLLCAKEVKYMTDHLKTIHHKTASEAVLMSKCNRAVKLGVVQKNKPVACPVPGCSSLVVRVNQHLRNIHKMDKNDEEYKRFVYYVLLKEILLLYNTRMKISAKLCSCILCICVL